MKKVLFVPKVIKRCGIIRQLGKLRIKETSMTLSTLYIIYPMLKHMLEKILSEPRVELYKNRPTK
jgi:hypothetical protein